MLDVVGRALSGQQVQVLRLRAQLLSGRPARHAVDVVERLLAVQAQDFRGFRLAVRARSAGLSCSDVHRDLTESRSLLVTWLNRGTLHLVRAEDYWWLHPLTAPPILAGNARRLAQEGVSPAAGDRGAKVIEAALAAEGPLLRSELRERVAAAGVPVAGQALIHILLLASLRGITVRGPVIEGEQAFVLVRDWLGPAPPAVAHDTALAELARRYLAGHGPATDRDLARWCGLPLGEARRGLGAIARLDDHPGGLVSLAGSATGSSRGLRLPLPLPQPRLLGSFDPLLHGWLSREPVVGRYQSLVTTNGIFRPVMLVDGRAVGTWTMPQRRVVLNPFEALSAEQTAALEIDAQAVEAFLEVR